MSGTGNWTETRSPIPVLTDGPELVINEEHLVAGRALVVCPRCCCTVRRRRWAWKEQRQHRGEVPVADQPRRNTTTCLPCPVHNSGSFNTPHIKRILIDWLTHHPALKWVNSAVCPHSGHQIVTVCTQWNTGRGITVTAVLFHYAFCAVFTHRLE